MTRVGHADWVQSGEAGWYVQLPAWLVLAGGDRDAFCERFTDSCRRMAGLPVGRLLGFEYPAPDGGVFRFVLPWFAPEVDGQIEQTTEGGAMPYTIRKRGDRYCVVKKADKHVVACHDTHAGAARQIAAIEASEQERRGY